MKRKILIALIVVLALSVSVLAGCNLSIMSIELKSGTLPTQYYVGQTVDLSKAKITVTKSDGTTEDVALTSSMLDKDISTAQEGEITYTVTYQKKTCEIKITVVKPAIAVKAGTLTTEYYVDDEVGYSGAKLTVTEGEAKRDVDLTADMVSPAISTAKVGSTTHTVTYNGATTTFSVTVSAPVISLVDGSLKLDYLVGETVDLSGAKISVKCGTRPATEVGFDKVTLDKEITTAATGKTTYTVSYNGATTTFEVTVRQVKEITSVGLDAEFIKDEQVSLTGKKLTVKYTDDTTGEVALTWNMLYAVIDGQVAASNVTSIDTTLGAGETEKTLTYAVKYGGQTYEIELTVRDVLIKSIAVSSDFATDYYIGYAAPDFTSEHLVVTLDNETADVRNMVLKNATFEPALPETFAVGTYNYTLTYGGKTATLTINVYDIELQIADGFKKSYNVGDPVFVSGKLADSQIKVVALNDAHTVLDTLDVTEAMVKEVFSTDTHGEKSLTIECKGKTLVVDDIVVNAIAIDVVTVGDDAFATKLVQGSTVNYAGKLQITYADNTTKLIDVNSNMFDPAISTATLGTTVYTVRYKDEETTVTIKVVPTEDNKVAFTTWMMPVYIRDYTTKSGNINTDPLDGGNIAFRKTAVYEVGNANKFLLAPVAFDNGPSVTSTIWTKASFAVKNADNTWTDLTGEALNEFVTIENNAYLFKNTADGKVVRITLTVDEDYHTVSAGIQTLTLEFVIVENGYNVYNQEGLAVMTDLIRPEIWADILGCTVDENGEYAYLPDASKALKLDADTQPLFKYVGNVDWIVLHGNITIDPDKLPDAYFWTDRDAGDQDYKVQYDAALNTLNGAAYADARKAMFLGSLRDWATPSGDNNGNYTICKIRSWTDEYGTHSSPIDDNNNKGLYCTTRINVSGNFNAVTILQGRSEGGRILESVVFRHTHDEDRKDEIGPQWHVFKMFEKSSDYGNPVKEFTIKNISLKGTTSLAGTTASGSDNKGKGNVSGGLAMVNFASKKAYAVNVLAEGFNVNFSGDNYFGGQIMELELDSCRIVNSFSAAIFGWRVKSNVVKSYLADFGGPAFIINDGDRRGGDVSETAPSVTLDKDSYAEAYAAGTEPWYAALDSKVTLMFGLLQLVDMQLKQQAGLTFFHNNGTGNRANVIAIMIPETGSVFPDQSAVEYKIKIQGSYTHVKDNFTVTASMTDSIFNQIIMAQDTIIISNGSNYAYVSNVAGDISTGQVSGVTLDPCSAFGGSWNSWKMNSTDTLTVWLQANTGKSPYIGVVIGDLTKVSA